MSLDHIWAGWRSNYVASASHKIDDSECVFCGLIAAELPANETNIVWRNDLVVAILNAFPYGTGHVLILPVRHVSRLDELETAESNQMWASINNAVTAIGTAYKPHGMNVGFNLGEGSGAGIPSHLHAHVLPRWNADTNFMTAVANTKVLPEALDVTWKKLSEAWPV